MANIRPKVFLGGTCNGSTWREELIPLLEIDYFNPVVEDWTPECQAEEIKQREECDFCLFFVRTDIPVAYQMVQANHACFEMGLLLSGDKRPKQVSHMVLCGIKNEEELEKLSSSLKLSNIDHHMFYEPDHNTGFTAICCEPIYGEQRKLFKKFKLLK